MAFSSRRGRPPAAPRLPVDLGTPELILKRLCQVTVEPLDVCLARGVIDEAQHWAAVHLRWLHTLRYGVAGVKARDLTDPGGHGPVSDDPVWREEREAEYNDAIKALKIFRADQTVLKLAVHHQRPGFLYAPDRLTACPVSRARIERAEREIAHLREGLDALCLLWGRKKQLVQRSETPLIVTKSS